MCGDGSKKDTPVPMPNTAVKLLSADGSWTFGPVRVGRCHASVIVILYNAVVNPLVVSSAKGFFCNFISSSTKTL